MFVITESAQAFEKEKPFLPSYYKACDDFKYKKESDKERELWFSKLIDKNSVKGQILVVCRIIDTKATGKNVEWVQHKTIFTFDAHPEPGKTETLVLETYFD